MKIIQAGKTIGKTLKNAGRLRTIVSVFARHGFHNVAERIQLGRYLLERLSQKSELENLSVACRIRMSFEELGPTFVKLGQLLATRPDLVPDSFVTEFEKLHASVQGLPFATIEQVLNDEFQGDYKKVFRSIYPEPLGSASIAQAHRAVLIDGTEVVVKVQRPGIVNLINDDLNVLYFIAELLEKYIEETRSFKPVAIVDEYFKTLELETDFLVEANNIRRFSENFKDNPKIKIPHVFLELSTERVLVLEALNGIPLSSDDSLSSIYMDRKSVMATGLSCYLQMVFKDGLFHGDLHAGNFFILPNNQIGLIDFGVVGRLNKRTQSAIANMMIALATEDYERLAYEYVDLAPFNEQTDVDRFARELRDAVAPYYGLTMKNVNFGRILMNTAAVSARNQVALPTEMMMFFKSIVTIEGLGRRIIKDFDFLHYALDFAREMAKHHYDSKKISEEFLGVMLESKALLYSLPRQIKYLLRKVNDPNFATKIDLLGAKDMNRALDRIGIMLYWGLVISSLIVSATLTLTQPSSHEVLGLPLPSVAGYSLAILFGAWAYFKKR